VAEVKTKVYKQYLDDGGATYTMRVRADYAVDAHAGWATYSPTDPMKPEWLKPRHVELLGADGRRRKLVCGSPTSDYYVFTNLTITEFGVGEATGQIYTVIARVGEHVLKGR